MVDANTIIFVAQEHCGSTVEKFFTTVEEYQNILEEVYGRDFIGVEYSSLEDDDAFKDVEYTDFITAMKDHRSIWFETKYRSVWVKAIDESQPIPESLLEVGSGDPAHALELCSYLEYSETVFDMLTYGREIFVSNGMSDEEVEHAVELQSMLVDRLLGHTFPMTQECFDESWSFHDLDSETAGLLYELYPYCIECWSSCHGPDDLPERLAAIGVPKRCYE
jgi:hypothetical protein